MTIEGKKYNLLDQFDDGVDGRDSVLYMKFRRLINEEFAVRPVDFNLQGLLVAQTALGRMVSENDIFLDVGSNDGQIPSEALSKSGLPNKLICLEPDSEAATYYAGLVRPDLLESEQLKDRVLYIRAVGEMIPLEDNSVSGASLHNVIFRAKDMTRLLKEVGRVVIPSGYIAISTNCRGHAPMRHYFEKYTSQRLAQLSGQALDSLEPPAQGRYLEDLEPILSGIESFELMKNLTVQQNTYAMITNERLQFFLQSIDYSSANVEGISDESRSLWRQIVHTEVREQIEQRLEYIKNAFARNYRLKEPFIMDPIKRGMLVVRNNKAA